MNEKDTVVENDTDKEERNWLNWREAEKKDEPKSLFGRVVAKIGKSISDGLIEARDEQYKNMTDSEKYEQYNKPNFMVCLFNLYFHFVKGLKIGENIELSGEGDLQDSKIVISRCDEYCSDDDDLDKEKMKISIVKDDDSIDFILYIEKRISISWGRFGSTSRRLFGLNVDVRKSGEYIGTFVKPKDMVWDMPTRVEFSSPLMTGTQQQNYEFEHAFMKKLFQVVELLEKKLPMQEFEAKTQDMLGQKRKELVEAIGG